MLPRSIREGESEELIYRCKGFKQLHGKGIREKITVKIRRTEDGRPISYQVIRYETEVMSLEQLRNGY